MDKFNAEKAATSFVALVSDPRISGNSNPKTSFFKILLRKMRGKSKKIAEHMA
ncbi:MAG: hypothetical protein K2Q26_03710 [Bdellovibrionales bacterium]|nr:hypothetical protein [Bdellovibrionales bacterium]